MIIKAYLRGFGVLAMVLLLTANWTQSLHLNWSWLTSYLLLSILVTYPLTQKYEKRVRFTRSASPRNAATRLHAQDLIEQDQGSWWRVAHTKAVLTPFDDNLLQSVLLVIIRLAFRTLLLVGGPAIVGGELLRRILRQRR